MDRDNKDFGKILLQLAKEFLEKEEEQRTKVEQDFLNHIDSIIDHHGKENDDKCRSIM